MLTERTDTESSASTTTLAKVTFNGETKRIRLDQGDFDSLVERTRASFDGLPEGQLKFFYVDDENDMISVSSQADLSEALDLSDKVCLTVASSARKAFDKFFEPAQEQPQPEDNLIEVVSEPGLLQIDTSDKMLQHEDDQAEMDALKAALAASNLVSDQNVDMAVAREIQQAAAIQQEDEGRSRDLQTAVIGEVQQAFAERFAHIFDPDLYDEMVEAEEEAAIASEKKMVNDMVSKLKEIFLGEVPSGNESTSATDANEDEESSDEEEELDEETKLLIASEVRRHFQEKIDEFYIPAAQAAVELQKEVVHEGVVCDGCGAYPIVGIRYKSSVAPNLDLCSTCEASDIHPDHVFCKIRRPEQTPVRLICQYKNMKPINIAAIMAQTQAAAAGEQEE